MRTFAGGLTAAGSGDILAPPSRPEGVASLKLLRFYAFGRTSWGRFHDGEVQVLDGSPFEGAGLQPTDTVVSAEAVEWLPPTAPTKIVCIGSNYRAHCVEMGRAVPAVPKLFLKPPSALLAHGGAIRRPDVGRVDFEGELAVVIGRRASGISPAEVERHLLGCTVLNDVTARELQRADVQFTRAKGFDTFCPVGPWIDTDVDPEDLAIETKVNGEVKQSSRTSDMVFGVRELVSFISNVMTLQPGDIVSTGTPSGVGPIVAGDRIAMTIEGIGLLENEVIDA